MLLQSKYEPRPRQKLSATVCMNDYPGAYMWQSRVEIEGYSVVYFNRIAAFEVPYH